MIDNMADNIKTACSSAFLKSREINCVVDPESVKYELLCVQDDDLLWKGDLESLKAFVETNLQLNGRWSSSRGESIQFSNPEFCIKWHGSTDKKLVILQDNDESQLFKTLQSYADNTDDANHGNEKKSSKQTPSKHMVQDGATETKSKQLACQNCNSFSDEISKIMDIVNELKNQHEDESRNTKAREAESNEKIQYLIDDRKKMATEIESLLATVTELTHENSAIKNILDMKQTEWVNTATKAKPSKENRPHPIQVENQFEILEVEDDINESESTAPDSSVQTTHDQILEYRSKARSKFTSQKNKQTKAQGKHSKTKKHEGKPEKQDKRTLVIGDSMVKNIDQQKIQRAAGDQSVVHSYSGAKVDQIMTKIKNGIMKDQFETVILHVGTNDLVHKDPELVATKMDRLITETKSKARKVAVSSVVKRYDGRVAASSITHFNNLVSNLCSQHNIVFLNNDHIGKSLLNRSDLHLNQSGDRALGSVFCTYLKSNRVKINNRPVNTRDEQVFPNAYRNCRKREWTTYLQFVNQMMRK